MKLKMILVATLLLSVLNAATVQTTKNTYGVAENIAVTVSGMLGHSDDWVGIYPAGTDNDWGNVLQWNYTGGIVNGTITLSNLPAGNYEARAFFQNSFNLEASYVFSVAGNGLVATVTTNKNEYSVDEGISIDFANMLGANKDWIAVYPAGSTNDWGNVVSWSFTGGGASGTLPFAGLPVGAYEVRAFFNNTFNLEANHAFTVVNNEPLPPTVYEAANGAISPNWVHVSGPYAPRYVSGTVELKARWISNTVNTSEYHLPLNSNSSQRILEVDLGGVGRWTPHYTISVYVTTTAGPRRMAWDSFFNHGNVQPFRNGIWNYYPSPVEHVGGNAKHFRVDVQEQLRLLEPNNSIVSIDTYVTTGGNHDNITLSSN